MRDAGRVSFIIKGYYNSQNTYEFLDVVYYGNSSYVAKKETIGNEPEESNEYWQIFARGQYASFQPVNSFSELPLSGSDGVFYLVPNGGVGKNNYDEYIWNPATSSYELIGPIQDDIDLTGYAKKTDIPTKLSQLQNDEEYVTQEEIDSMGFVNEDDISVPTYEEALALLNE